MTLEKFLDRIDEIMCGTSNAERAYLEDIYNEVVAPHWISVEDELPKLNSGMVIVATYKGDIDFMIFSNSGWHNSKRWCCVKGVITHWMPLPQAPTVAENATVKEKGGEHDTEE